MEDGKAGVMRRCRDSRGGGGELKMMIGLVMVNMVEAIK